MKKKIAKKFGKYFVIGSWGFIIDLFLLWFLTEIIGMYYLISATISVILVSLFGYSLDKKYVFVNSQRKFFKGYAFFLLITLTKILAIIALLFLFVEIFNIYYLLARILIGIIIVFLTYFLNTKFTFKTGFN